MQIQNSHVHLLMMTGDNHILAKLRELAGCLDGDVYTDDLQKIIYSTDASVYREMPLAVIRPKNSGDIKKIVSFCSEQSVPLTPRAAGTSLAGQAVGKGIIADFSKYLNNIIEINTEQKWALVEPGVILDELNNKLAEYNLFFGPETSTSNRCTIGGMAGNNACGSHSLLYGSTRDHILEIKAVLSDGSEAVFKPLNEKEFKEKCNGDSLENKVYRQISEILSGDFNKEEIREQFPDKRIKRRNTGYAIDILLETGPFSGNNVPFNFCKLLAGSEGTLALITEIKLNIVDKPPPYTGLVCIHLKTLEEAFPANLVALKHNPSSVELMDKAVLDLTKESTAQRKNRFFIEGEPEALLIVEFMESSPESVQHNANELENDMRKYGYGYHFPLIRGGDTKNVWNLRKAGLGVLSNLPGDAKPVPVIEDTAVHPEQLPEYMKCFGKLLEKYQLSCIYYAHIATGELHLRPVINLKTREGAELFRNIALETAKLVKSFGGSLSGEHGDGKLRGEFVSLMLGGHCYSLLKKIKECWDPENIFNPGKIINAEPMNTGLRYEQDKPEKIIETVFDFSREQGILRAAEKCNGSADCRKTHNAGGTMCPSYMASLNENQSTRARANLLREYLTKSNRQNPFSHPELYEIMDLCLSCKACKSECPSNVDITKLKAEFLQHYYDSNRIPLRTRIIAHLPHMNRYLSLFPRAANFLSQTFRTTLGFTVKRNLPALYNTTLTRYFNTGKECKNEKPDIFLLADEITNYYDVELGVKTVLLLKKLGYNVRLSGAFNSGRTLISKGLLRKARNLAEKNLDILKDVISAGIPVIGIEPSAVLTLRDEYPELVRGDLKQIAIELKSSAFLIDEFISSEILKGKIPATMFTGSELEIIVHGHCYQKALSSVSSTITMLSVPVNYRVSEIPSGCCGMGGAFGYEKEHYELSLKTGELVLFPEIRKLPESTVIAATGSGCRQHIFDGTGCKTLHPVEVLYDALL